jgi:hypothetical protein
VGGQDDLRFLVERVLNSRQGCADPRIVYDNARRLVLHDIKIHADEDAFFGDVQVLD